MPFKGLTKRTSEEQVALAVRIYDEMHFQDVLDRAKAELGQRINVIGPLDLTRNTLRGWVDRVNRTHETPPLVSGLAPGLAALVGDQSASVTRAKYAKAGGQPMPTNQVVASHEARGYAEAAGYAGVALSWAARSEGLALTVVPPDDLGLVYTSDDPWEPTIVRHTRSRFLGGRMATVEDVYDLTDLDAPRFYVTFEGRDVLGEVEMSDEDRAALVSWPDGWRYKDGRPFHRIVITGSTRRPFRTNQLIEATLTVAVRWSSWGAGIRDAGYPQRNAIGLHLAGMDSHEGSGETGVATGPETVLVWEYDDQERPGMLHQFGPGYDPEAIGRTIRQYELGAMSALGLPVDYESTGGDPTDQERQALETLIAQTYPACRRLDSEILRRAAAIARAVGAGTYSEEPYGILYRGEVAEALADTTEGGSTDARRDEPGGAGGADEGGSDPADEAGTAADA